MHVCNITYLLEKIFHEGDWLLFFFILFSAEKLFVPVSL